MIVNGKDIQIPQNTLVYLRLAAFIVSTTTRGRILWSSDRTVGLLQTIGAVFKTKISLSQNLELFFPVARWSSSVPRKKFASAWNSL